MTVVSGDGLEFDELPGRRSANPFTTTPADSSLRVVRLERSEGRRAHRHPRSEEIVYIEAGSGSVWIDGETHRVSRGDVVRIPQGAAHATIPDDGSEMVLVCFFPHPDLAENIEDTDTAVT